MRLVLAFVLLGLSLVHTSCGLWPAPLASTATPVPTPIPTPTAAPMPTPTAANPTAPLNQVDLNCTPTPENQVHPQEARQLVEDYYRAIESGDFARLTALTTGQAQEVTTDFIDQLRQTEQQYGVEAMIQVRELTLLDQATVGCGELVHTRVVMETSGEAGPLTLPGPTLAGEARFYVQRVDGRLLVTRLDQNIRQQSEPD